MNEEGSEDVRGQIAEAAVVTTSQIAYAEGRAALARRRRERALRPRGFLAAKHAFEADWPHLVAIDVTADLCHEAGALAERYALRGFDALHLAAFAEVLRGLQGRADVQFSCFDGPLNRAAAKLARSIR